jgi:2-hydroxyacyl-CoA lyase 1
LPFQNADVVFLMGARFNWIFHPGFRRAGFGRPPRYAKDMKVVQLDIAPTRSATTRQPRWPWSATGKATGQLNAALGARQWFYPKDTL